VPRRKRKTGRISVFKGREARLNRVIFFILALKGPQTIYDMRREVRKQKHLAGTKYPVVNRRVRRLEESNYLEKAGTRKIKTQPGDQAILYQLTSRAYLAILLDELNLHDFVRTASEESIITTLATLISHTRT
jgi:hypothetical protein